MKQNLSELYKTNRLKACQLALRRTARLPDENRMQAIDKILQTYNKLNNI